jgi:hypothetical protein
VVTFWNGIIGTGTARTAQNRLQKKKESKSERGKHTTKHKTHKKLKKEEEEEERRKEEEGLMFGAKCECPVSYDTIHSIIIFL